MAKVVEGFLLGTHYDLTFYLMNGKLYVRMKSSLSRKKVKYSPRFVRTMQSAEELRRASRLASRIYWELSKEQKKKVFVLYKKMTGVAKLAFKYGKSEAEAEREVREYLVREGVVKEEEVVVKEQEMVREQVEVEVKVGEKKVVKEEVKEQEKIVVERKQDERVVVRKQKEEKVRKQVVKRDGVVAKRKIVGRRGFPGLVMVYHQWEGKVSARKRRKRLSRCEGKAFFFCDSS